MKSITSLIALMLVMSLGLFCTSCTCDDDDDDDDSGNDDATDDDTTDDDTTDDDATDDDTGDDDDDDDTGDDGTWTDSTSGLTWQVTPSDGMIWEDAKSYCDNLSLDGGGWHLPTITELRTLIRGCDGTLTGGSCGVTDDCLDLSCSNDSCYSCDYDAGPNNGCYGPSELPGECNSYWSSSAVADLDDTAWAVYLSNGRVDYLPIDYYDGYFARCVRP